MNNKNKNKELLPLGSIVYLQEGTQKLMIIGRGVIFDDEETGKKHSLIILVFCTQWAFKRNRQFSLLFDKVYDDNIEEVGNWIGKTYEGAKKNVGNFVDSVSDTAEKIWDSAGDVVNGFFSGLGSVF